MSRTLVNWIKYDADSRHSLLLTRQEYPHRIPSWLREAITQNGGKVIIFPLDAEVLVKAKWVRQLVQSSVDIVILHVSCSDLVPTVAFAVKDCPPIALVNQVDHLFWVGSSVVDIVINLRGVEDGFNERRRFAKQTSFLPIPLWDSANQPGRDEARRALGIAGDHVLLLTVGRDVKYLPDGQRSFFATARKILEQNPAAHLYAIGVTQAYARGCLGDPQHPRLHLLGIIEDPAVYQAAADVYLESFPVGSQTALLEAGLAGTFPVRAYAPACRLLATYDEAIDEICAVPADEGEYVAQANALVRDPSKRRRLGLVLRERILAMHGGSGWRVRLESLYHTIQNTRHDPRPLPTEECSITREDIAISTLHDSLQNRSIAEMWRSNSTEPSLTERSGATEGLEALHVLIRLLRDRSQRSSRRASLQLFELLAMWIDDAARLRGGHRNALRADLLATLAERMTWAKWERDWASYWELRSFVQSGWGEKRPLPAIATVWIAPRFVYAVKDVLDRLARRNGA